MTERILLTGPYEWDFYEAAFARALRAVGAEVSEIPARRLFGPGRRLRRVQARLLVGPGVVLVNVAVIAACIVLRPDCLLAWRSPWLSPLVLRCCRLVGAKRVAIYNNDDPFGPDATSWQWRRYRRAIPAADICFAYREANLAEYRAAGAQAAKLLRSGFEPALHHPVELSPEDIVSYGCDVVFVGHFEDDGRARCLDRLAREGFDVRIFGSGWDAAGPIEGIDTSSVAPVLGVEYVKAIAAARVALVFLSARNRDTYTRRCFEIPAIGSLMLAPRTADLTEMFEEGVEAAFFEDEDELVEVARSYLADDSLRAVVACAGRRRVLRDGHDITSRARSFLEDIRASME